VAYTETRVGGHIGRYRVDGKLMSTRVFTRKRDAAEEAERQENAAKRGTWTDPDLGKVTVSEWFARWSQTRTGKARRTQEDERERFESLVEPTWGSTRLDRITFDGLSRWSLTMHAKRKSEIASQSRRRDATRLFAVAMLDAAVDARLLPRNPGRTPSGKVPYMPAPSTMKAHRYLTHEQLRRVADAAGGDARRLILIAGYTGPRWGELSALTVADSDPLRGRLTIGKAYTRLGDGTLLLGPTKTRSSRTVVVPSPLRSLLVDQIEGKRRDALVFGTVNGDPIRRENFARRHLDPAVSAAGGAVSTLQGAIGMPSTLISGVYDEATTRAVCALQAAHGIEQSGIADARVWALLVRLDGANRSHLSHGEKVKRTSLFKALSRTTLAQGAEDFARLTLHDLRHTAASLAISAGATVKAVQNMLGHESAELTLNTYAGLFPGDQDDLADRLGEAFMASAAHHVLTEPDASVISLPVRAATSIA
jgi:integrase